MELADLFGFFFFLGVELYLVEQNSPKHHLNDYTQKVLVPMEQQDPRAQQMHAERICEVEQVGRGQLEW